MLRTLPRQQSSHPRDEYDFKHLHRELRRRAWPFSDMHVTEKPGGASANAVQTNSRQLAATVSSTSSIWLRKRSWSSPARSPRPAELSLAGHGQSVRVVTMSTGGPLWASACLSAGRTSAGSSTRTLKETDGLCQRGEVGILQLHPKGDMPATSISSWTMANDWLLKRMILTASRADRASEYPPSTWQIPIPDSAITCRPG